MLECRIKHYISFAFQLHVLLNGHLIQLESAVLVKLCGRLTMLLQVVQAGFSICMSLMCVTLMYHTWMHDCVPAGTCCAISGCNMQVKHEHTHIQYCMFLTVFDGNSILALSKGLSHWFVLLVARQVWGSLLTSQCFFNFAWEGCGSLCLRVSSMLSDMNLNTSTGQRLVKVKFWMSPRFGWLPGVLMVAV